LAHTVGSQEIIARSDILSLNGHVISMVGTEIADDLFKVAGIDIGLEKSHFKAKLGVWVVLDFGNKVLAELEDAVAGYVGFSGHLG
jgi:hypothetical protein